MNPNNIELLAPAGSYEGFEAALGAGADAVYVGGAMFGARAYAQNFNEEELSVPLMWRIFMVRSCILRSIPC